MESMPIAIGMAWYRRNDYEAIRLLMADGDRLPLDFDKWEQLANKVRKEQIAQGRMVIQAYIDPKTFAEWCLARGLEVDAKARMRFANEEAIRVARQAQQHGNERPGH